MSIAKNSKAASVTFNNVTKIYGKDVLAVDDVSIEIEPGKLVTLLGPSGCGKTTTLRMIAGLEMATSGQILIGERDVTRLPATDRDVSMVFQSYALFPHMNVLENVSYGLKFSGFDKTNTKNKAMEGLSLVGLEDLATRLPSELSGGQQQRVAVARALVLEPQVLLFDEPLSNLDAKLRRQVREEIREIQQKLGLTVVYVTHDQEEALAVSDRIIVMRNAQIAQEGSPRELYEVPNDAFVADFIGEANLIQCTIDQVKGETATATIGGYRFSAPARDLATGTATLAIRPSRVLISNKSTKNSLKATIRKATYVGSHMEYSIEAKTTKTHVETIFATSIDVNSVHKVGEDVFVTFAQGGAVLLPQTPETM